VRGWPRCRRVTRDRWTRCRDGKSCEDGRGAVANRLVGGVHPHPQLKLWAEHSPGSAGAKAPLHRGVLGVRDISTAVQNGDHCVEPYKIVDGRACARVHHRPRRSGALAPAERRLCSAHSFSCGWGWTPPTNLYGTAPWPSSHDLPSRHRGHLPPICTVRHRGHPRTICRHGTVDTSHQSVRYGTVAILARFAVTPPRTSSHDLPSRHVKRHQEVYPWRHQKVYPCWLWFRWRSPPPT
jgi:hypothetical protein